MYLSTYPEYYQGCISQEDGVERVDQSRLLEHFPVNGRPQNNARLRDRQHLSTSSLPPIFSKFLLSTVTATADFFTFWRDVLVYNTQQF